MGETKSPELHEYIIKDMQENQDMVKVYATLESEEVLITVGFNHYVVDKAWFVDTDIPVAIRMLL